MSSTPSKDAFARDLSIIHLLSMTIPRHSPDCRTRPTSRKTTRLRCTFNGRLQDFCTPRVNPISNRSPNPARMSSPDDDDNDDECSILNYDPTALRYPPPAMWRWWTNEIYPLAVPFVTFVGRGFGMFTPAVSVLLMLLLLLWIPTPPAWMLQGFFSSFLHDSSVRFALGFGNDTTRLIGSSSPVY